LQEEGEEGETLVMIRPLLRFSVGE
jgi:hypothetical protein